MAYYIPAAPFFIPLSCPDRNDITIHKRGTSYLKTGSSLVRITLPG